MSDEYQVSPWENTSDTLIGDDGKYNYSLFYNMQRNFLGYSHFAAEDSPEWKDNVETGFYRRPRRLNYVTEGDTLIVYIREE